MKINSRFTTAVCALAALSTFMHVCRAAEAPIKLVVPDQQIQILGVQTVTLTQDAASAGARFPAQVVSPPNAEQIVSSPVAGLVSQLMVQENQAVQPGTPLVSVTGPEIGRLQLELLQASARATLARQAAAREQQLFDEGIIPQRRVQEAHAALKETDAAFKHAKGTLHLGGMSAAAIDQIIASGNPQSSIALVATQAGTVADITVKTGQRVDAASPLLRLVRSDILWLDIQVPASESAGWKAGTTIKVANRDVTAKLLSTSPVVSPESQMVLLRAEVENKDRQLRLGEVLAVEMPLADAVGGWNVPLSSVAHSDDAAVVFVRTANGFEARPVTIAASSGQQVRVRGQIRLGEKIAVSGVVALKGAWLNEKAPK